MSGAVLTLHHLPNSRSQRIVWLLEELQLPYELVLHQPSPSAGLGVATLKSVHRLGKVPTLVDHSGPEPVVLAESGAIVEYLLVRHGHGRLQPPLAGAEGVRALYWRHFAEGSLMPYLAMKLVFAGVWQRTPWLLRPAVWPVVWSVNRFYLNPNLRTALDWMEQQLQGQTWLAGDTFSAAEVLMGFLLEAAVGRLTTADEYPNLHGLLARIQARPAYQQALQRGQWSATQHARHWAGLKY